MNSDRVESGVQRIVLVYRYLRLVHQPPQALEKAQRRLDLRSRVRLDRDVPVEAIVLQRRERRMPVDGAVHNPGAFAGERIDLAILEVHVSDVRPGERKANGKG